MASVWRTLRRKPLGIVGVVLLAALLIMAIGAPFIAPYDPAELTGKPFEPPSPQHLLGTNDIGQDILSELIFGTRVSLLIGVLAAALATVIGTSVGVTAGYFRGTLGSVLMRVVDVVLVIPFLPLMVLLAAYLGPSLWNLIIVIGLLIWARAARVIRSQAMSLAGREYNTAARALGATDWHILFKHVLPGVLPLTIAQFVLAASGAILLEASLSFLGLGDPTQKSWGSVLYYAQARNAFLSNAWQWWVLPTGLLITACVLSFALLGFALEERVDTRLTRGR